MNMQPALLQSEHNRTETTSHRPHLKPLCCSIVHSEEEIAGSYNWDYLLDWGPQYQPLAHVFHEISALKDEAGESSVQLPSARTAPPIITCRPPRHAHSVVAGGGAGGGAGPGARSPIQPELLPAGHQAAMSPSFSPALSPLATRSPSISPLGNPARRATIVSHQPQYDVAGGLGELGRI